VQYLAGQVSAALATADLSAFADLLDPDVQWGAPGDPVPSCQNRDQVLAWYRRGRESGTRGRVTETQVSGDRILVGLKVTHDLSDDDAGSETDRWQVLTVRGGRVAAIVGFDNRDDAAAWAGLVHRPATTEPPRWSPPGQRLADELVELRLPEPADAEALYEYATLPDGMDGGWAPLGTGARLASCEAVVSDWLAGWHGAASFHGPELVIVPAGQTRLVGLVGLQERDGRVVELSYGVAPAYRGRGFGSHAARLAAQWLLMDGQADEVELRIGADNVASQRAALAAGFTPAGTVTSHAAGSGESYEDLRFVLTGK
jgi:RimJ/RimL family protein N-acetyltransferase/ketosteroid isomerase-like protein